MKILFMGTPEFAVASLEAVFSSKHSVVGVVTQPDRAVKHGRTEKGAVKLAAEKAGLPVFQPVKIRDEVDTLKNFGADIAVTAAYGQLLTQEVLDAFEYGVINVHASLLPKYRGASPVQAAIAAGEKQTGVTIMRTELGLDTGDILSAEHTDIGADETAGELMSRLADIGAKLLVKTLDEFPRLKPIKQDDAQATRCRTITKAEQYIDFGAPAQKVIDRIRSLCPSPCAKTVIDGDVYKIYKAKVADGKFCGQCGEIVCSDGKLVVACGDGAVEILNIQAPSKRAMGIAEFLRGRKFKVGVICAKP